MPTVPQDTFEKRQRQRKKQDARADKAYRRQLRREDRQNRAGGAGGEETRPSEDPTEAVDDRPADDVEPTS